MYDIAFQHPYPKRWNLIDSIRSNSFTHLQSKEGYLFRVAVAELAAKRHIDDKALLIAQLAKMDYLQRSSKVDLRRFEEWYKSSLEEADRVNFAEIKSALTFLYAANLNLNYKQDVQSLYFLNKAIDYSSVLRKDNSTQKGLLLSGVTRIFYQFDDFVNAVRYGKEVEKYDINKVEKFLTLDIAGVSYLKLKNYDSAQIYIDKSLQMFYHDFAKEDDKKVWYGILMGNKAHVFKGLGNVTDAIRYYRIGIDETYNYHLLDNTCRFAIGLADLYLSQKNIAEAGKLIPLARKATYSQGTDSDHLQLHQLLSKYYKEVGNMSLVVLHKDSTQYWTEVLEKRRGKNVQIQADLKLETERRQNAEMTLDKNIRQQKINRIITIVIILLVTGLAFVGILRQRLLMKVREKELKIKQQEAEKQLLLEQEKAKREQMLAQLKLEEFTNIIVAKNKQIEMLEAENERGSNDASIRQLQSNTLLTEEQWVSFKLLFEKVHTGYLQRLKEKIPTISPAEIRFMALAKLKLDSKEMASSLGVSPNAVRNVWFRLRKKIDLPEEVTWNDFADTI
ncbi:MAG: hypothetical protein U0X91_08825 [Spirosomataceae bacterium]